jgi:hypothetical protein
MYQILLIAFEIHRCKDIKLKSCLDLNNEANPIIAGVGVLVANEVFKGVAARYSLPPSNKTNFFS